MAISAIELLVSNLERRALTTGDRPVYPRLCDLPPLLPAITGKLEMVYEGEQQGPEVVARKLIGDGGQEALRRPLPRARARERLAVAEPSARATNRAPMPGSSPGSPPATP